MMRDLHCDSLEELENTYDCKLINLKDLYKMKYHLLPEENISRERMMTELSLNIKETEPDYPGAKGYHICHTYKTLYQKMNNIEPLTNEMDELWSIAMEYASWSLGTVHPTPDGDEIDIRWAQTNNGPRVGITLGENEFTRIIFASIINTPDDIYIKSFSWKDLGRESKMRLLKRKCEHIIWGETREFKKWRYTLRSLVLPRVFFCPKNKRKLIL
jgi:hypothetical protein